MIRAQRELLALMLLFAGLAGCGPSGAATAPVKGKVLADGQPVTGGTLILSPADGLAAAPADGDVQPDGTFAIAGDGAAIGKHTVTYSAPPDEQADWDGYGKEPPVKASPFKGLVAKEPEVEIKAGDNDITIELVRGRLP
jgi:hypothetical protein